MSGGAHPVPKAQGQEAQGLHSPAQQTSTPPTRIAAQRGFPGVPGGPPPGAEASPCGGMCTALPGSEHSLQVSPKGTHILSPSVQCPYTPDAHTPHIATHTLDTHTTDTHTHTKHHSLTHQRLIPTRHIHMHMADTHTHLHRCSCNTETCTQPHAKPTQLTYTQ